VIYLSVPPNAERWETMARAGIGVMMTRKSGMHLARTLAYPCWAADNDCFSSRRAFSLGDYLDWLARMAPARASCLFASAPDVVGDAGATWERSRDVLPVLRELGYRAALVAQDGLERLPVDWAAFDVLFVGGTTAWKLSEAAYGLVREARRRGKWAHQGRCNSRRRLRAAAVGGYDSADGTLLAFGPDKRLAQLLRWLGELERQPALFVG
jgi:hypothetical protein